MMGADKDGINKDYNILIRLRYQAIGKLAWSSII